MYKSGVAAVLAGSLLCAAATASCPPPGRGHLAIIVDDLGYNLGKGIAIAELPAPVTLSIIPQTPHAHSVAERGRERGKEIMVHLPMSAAHTRVRDPLVLTADLGEEAFDTLIDDAVTAVPGATGMNNHMGSKLTVNRTTMERFLARLKARGMFFIDSRTTSDSIAADVARDMDIPVASRSVFLDNERDIEAIEQRLDRAIAIAQQTGSAIAIGHPYPETLQVLTEALPRMAQDVTLTRASQVAGCQTGQRLTSMP